MDTFADVIHSLIDHVFTGDTADKAHAIIDKASGTRTQEEAPAEAPPAAAEADVPAADVPGAEAPPAAAEADVPAADVPGAEAPPA